jgi:amino acid permease
LTLIFFSSIFLPQSQIIASSSTSPSSDPSLDREKAAIAELLRLANEANAEPVTFVVLGRDLIHPSTQHFIRFGIIATILGVCGVYLVLIAHLMEQVLAGKIVPGTNGMAWSQDLIKWIMLGPIILLANLRKLKYLAFTSILGMCVSTIVLDSAAQFHASRSSLSKVFSALGLITNKPEFPRMAL